MNFSKFLGGKPKEKLFFDAIKNGDLDTIRDTLQRQPEMLHWHLDHNRAGPLLTALQADQKAAFDLLLELGAPPNENSFTGLSGLLHISVSAAHVACIKGRLDYLHNLVKHGGSVYHDEDIDQAPGKFRSALASEVSAAEKNRDAFMKANPDHPSTVRYKEKRRAFEPKKKNDKKTPGRPKPHRMTQTARNTLGSNLY